MTTHDDSARPRAFRMPQAQPTLEEEPESQRVVFAGPAKIEVQADAFSNELPPEEVAIEAAQAHGFLRKGLGWGGLFGSALAGLISLALGLWAVQLVENLFQQTPLLGYIALALAIVAALALCVLAGRELRAISRQKHIVRLHAALAQDHAADDRQSARQHLQQLSQIYSARPQTKTACQEIARLSTQIIDGRDLINIAERELMLPLDQQARRAVANAAKRVSFITALSPSALVDIVFVGAQAVYIIRKVAEIYGGRPGLLGLIKLARAVGAHLAITGGVAIGDSLLQQVLGHGIAAKLSARLGEGVLNGLLTARVGISAIAVCRPMPFVVEPPPGVKDVAPELFSTKK